MNYHKPSYIIINQINHVTTEIQTETTKITPLIKRRIRATHDREHGVIVIN